VLPLIAYLFFLVLVAAALVSPSALISVTAALLVSRQVDSSRAGVVGGSIALVLFWPLVFLTALAFTRDTDWFIPAGGLAAFGSFPIFVAGFLLAKRGRHELSHISTRTNGGRV